MVGGGADVGVPLIAIIDDLESDFRSLGACGCPNHQRPDLAGPPAFAQFVRELLRSVITIFANHLLEAIAEPGRRELLDRAWELQWVERAPGTDHQDAPLGPSELRIEGLGLHDHELAIARLEEVIQHRDAARPRHDGAQLRPSLVGRLHPVARYDLADERLAVIGDPARFIGDY